MQKIGWRSRERGGAGNNGYGARASLRSGPQLASICDGGEDRGQAIPGTPKQGKGLSKPRNEWMAEVQGRHCWPARVVRASAMPLKSERSRKRESVCRALRVASR